MNKKNMMRGISAILCVLVCSLSFTTNIYGAEVRLTEDFTYLSKSDGYRQSDMKLPDKLVTYKDGACTIENLPQYAFSNDGSMDYKYEIGSQGVFMVTSQPSDYSDIAPVNMIVNTNTIPTTAIKVVWGKEEYSKTPVKVFENGKTAFVNSMSVILVEPDGTTGIKLWPSVPEGYKISIFGVDYSTQSKQYAVMYGLYDGIFASTSKQRAGIAIFDETGKIEKQFILKGLYYDNALYSAPGGYREVYSYCSFSADSDTLYASGMIPKSLIDNMDLVELEPRTGKEKGYYPCYEIDLTNESYKGLSKSPDVIPEFPFKVQYNTTGTYVYTGTGKNTTTLAYLDDAYVAASYSVSHDGSVQIIFVPVYAGSLHPMAKKYTPPRVE